jgi:hypothetical protein
MCILAFGVIRFAADQQLVAAPPGLLAQEEKVMPTIVNPILALMDLPPGQTGALLRGLPGQGHQGDLPEPLR